MLPSRFPGAASFVPHPRSSLREASVPPRRRRAGRGLRHIDVDATGVERHPIPGRLRVRFDDRIERLAAPDRLALDWTPNTDHTGFFVARHEGWYRDAAIDLQILPYATATPETLLA